MFASAPQLVGRPFFTVRVSIETLKKYIKKALVERVYWYKCLSGIFLVKINVIIFLNNWLHFILYEHNKCDAGHFFSNFIENYYWWNLQIYPNYEIEISGWEMFDISLLASNNTYIMGPANKKLSIYKKVGHLAQILKMTLSLRIKR